MLNNEYRMLNDKQRIVNDKTSRRIFVKPAIIICVLSFWAALGCASEPPVDETGRPLIKKLGTIDCDMVETTPIVFGGRLYRFEYVRGNYKPNKTGDSYFCFVDHKSGHTTPPFAKGYHLGSAFVDGDTVYVTGTNAWGGQRVEVFASKDLKHWESWTALELPGFGIFNTSMWKADDKYVLMFEIGKPAEQAGVGFTARFATSRNLRQWELTPPECVYTKERYSAPHCLRYLDGYFYDFYLEAHNGYEMRVVRSKDLIHWEPSPLNPVLRWSADDKKIANPQLTAEQQQKIAEAKNINNSDIDFCEHKGRVIINYSWGDQQGTEFLAEAVYEGTLEQFLKGWYPREQPAIKETKQHRDERMKWWREARFGMFIHWGVYSVPAGTYKGKRIPGIGEWIMERADIPVAEYEQFAKQFNPVKFNADEWVQIARNAGMKYIVITSKHHDGFCLWDSKVTNYDIMDASPFKRDILKELSVACKKHGIRLCFYHSIMDWHHPDAQATFYPNYNNTGRSNPKFPRYVKNYMKPQLRELITNYGPLGVLWFDGEWIKDWTEPQGRDLYNYVRSLQPDIIVNNRVGKGRKGMQGLTKEGHFAGDFGTPEQEIPPTGLAGVDWETCMTMNDTWGFKSYDHNCKSMEDLIHKLVDIASKGGNFLLNVGPTAEGIIPEASAERLAAMGKWMAKNSESIYGTTASPFEKLPWGRCTTKFGKLYLHVFDWPKNGELKVPMPRSKVQKAYLLAHKDRAELLLDSDDSGNLVVTIPRKVPDAIDTVVLLEKEAEVAVVAQAKDGTVALKASDAVVRGTNARYESGGGKDNIGYWTNPNDYVVWRFYITKTGTFDVEVTFACATGAGGSDYTLSIFKQELTAKVKDTGSWTNFVTENIGTLKITKSGTYDIWVKPKTMPRGAVMNLKSATLVPIKK